MASKRPSKTAATEAFQVGTITRPRTLLYPKNSNDSLLATLMKGSDTAADPSQQGVSPGRKERPFDFKAVTTFQVSNIHHSRCLHAKTASTVGMGFEDKKVLEILNPLCESSFQDVLNDIAEDYWQTGNAYLEVIREGGNPFGNITGLYRVPSYEVSIWIEDRLYNRHYEVLSNEQAGNVRYAKFGDLQDFMKRREGGMPRLAVSTSSEQRTGEIIHFRRSTTLSRWYGFPDWLSAVASIELVQMLKQHTFDFFNNRGVPEFMLFLLGQKLGKEEWQTILDSLKANIGSGNAHKSVALNIQDPNMKVQLEKLALEGKTDNQFADMAGLLAHEIVSAHGVPPLLAGIQIPGKLGATNELPNALVAFQILVVGPAQQSIEQTLGMTLGNPLLNGGLPLTNKDFNLQEITEQLDIAAIDTAARMRDSAASPEGKARIAGAAPSGLAPGVGMGGTMKKGAHYLTEEQAEAALAFINDAIGHRRERELASVE